MNTYRVTGSYWCHTHNQREVVCDAPIEGRSPGDAIFAACEFVQDDPTEQVGHDWYDPEWKATQDRTHSFNDGNEKRILDEDGNGYVAGKCPITGEMFQHSYTDHDLAGPSNSCWSCGTDKRFSLAEKLTDIDNRGGTK